MFKYEFYYCLYLLSVITFINISGLDSDAKAFLDATAITDATITMAINTLVIDLKGFGIWTKCRAIYPMVGGTATTHMYNLKDPQNTNAAFRLSFSGGWTHSSTGALPNGINAAAETHLSPSAVLAQNSMHISAYSRSNTMSTTPIISNGISGSNFLNIYPRFSNQLFFRVNSGGTASVGANTDSTGFYIANRISSSETRNRRNTTLHVQSAASTGIAANNIWLSREISFSVFDNRQIAFSTIGDGLTDQETLDLYNSIQSFQTTLSRQV